MNWKPEQIKRVMIFTGYLKDDNDYAIDSLEKFVKEMYPEKRCRFIKEIETSLHPIDQSLEVQKLLEENYDVLAFTTNSVYPLTTLNNCIEAYSVAQNRSGVEGIINPKHWLNIEDVAAYEVEGRHLTDMISEDNLIYCENLDSVSDLLMMQFEALLDLKYNE